MQIILEHSTTLLTIDHLYGAGISGRIKNEDGSWTNVMVLINDKRFSSPTEEIAQKNADEFLKSLKE